MPTLSRSAPSRTVPIAFALCLWIAATAAGSAERAVDWRRAGSFEHLVTILDVWLDENSPYPARAEAARVQIVSPQRILALSPSATRLWSRRRGLYDPDTATIYLARPWSMRNPQDASVLLHELIHHRQTTARHWVCPGQQELPAYRLQQAWLAEQGETIAINWIAAALASGCTPRDFHPD